MSKRSVRTPWLTWVFAVPVLGISLVGFGSKFVEFVQTFRDSPDGVFAITPVLNYLLASLGFFCLLVWAGMKGMFRDLEQPKLTMLEREDALNQQEGPGRLVRSVTCAVPIVITTDNL